jgi:hypothetical protein
MSIPLRKSPYRFHFWPESWYYPDRSIAMKMGDASERDQMRVKWCELVESIYEYFSGRDIPILRGTAFLWYQVHLSLHSDGLDARGSIPGRGKRFLSSPAS